MRADGSVFALEANANPHLAEGEDFAKSAALAGRSYRELLAQDREAGARLPGTMAGAVWLIPEETLLAVVLVLPWLAACNTTATRGEAALNELVAMLPGTYDNLAQSRAAPDHAALRMAIAPVQAPLVGDHVYYVQEMAADDPRRVLSQRLYVLNCRAGQRGHGHDAAGFHGTLALARRP